MAQPYQPAPHHLSTIVYSGFEEIIGRTDLAELLHDESDLITASSESGGSTGDWMGSLGRLEQLYGQSGARGVAHRAGRASFRHWLRQFGEPLHLAQLDFRLMPARSRFRFGFDAIAKTLQAQWGMAIELIEEELSWRWRLTDCPACRLDGQASCCSYLAGFLQEYLCWISGGKYFPVNEVQRSERDRQICEVVLWKQPLD